MMARGWALILSGMMVVSISTAPIGRAVLATENVWVQGNVVELQALDKITARISTLTAEVGKPSRYGTLELMVHACTFRPPTMPPENAALIEISSVDHKGLISDEPIFKGWMFASSPALNALEHPVYDVSVLDCRKD
jgi:hypothetical protein